MRRSPEARFWDRVSKTESCWLFGGSLLNGYGRFAGTRAHRFSYRMAHGFVPPGLQVLHRCDVRNCVRPDHLFLGTLQDNMDDMKAKRRSANGERSGASKFTDQQITEMRALAHQGVKRREIAERYGANLRHVFRVLAGDTRRNPTFRKVEALRLAD